VSTVEVVVKIKLPDGHESVLTKDEAERLASDIHLSLGKSIFPIPHTPHPPWKPVCPQKYLKDGKEYRKYPIITCKDDVGDGMTTTITRSGWNSEK